MNIQSEKIQLAKMLLDTQNPKIMEQIKEIFDKNKEEDFYYSLTEEEKEWVELGKQQVAERRQ